MSGYIQSVHCQTEDNGGRPYLFLIFANVSNFLNIFRGVGSGHAMQLQGDVTYKASKAALNKNIIQNKLYYTNYLPIFTNIYYSISHILHNLQYFKYITYFTVFHTH